MNLHTALGAVSTYENAAAAPLPVRAAQLPRARPSPARTGTSRSQVLRGRIVFGVRSRILIWAGRWRRSLLAQELENCVWHAHLVLKSRSLSSSVRSLLAASLMPSCDASICCSGAHAGSASRPECSCRARSVYFGQPRAACRSLVACARLQICRAMAALPVSAVDAGSACVAFGSASLLGSDVVAGMVVCKG